MHDSSSDTNLLSPSEATITASLQVDTPYFQNGLVRANVTWRAVNDDQGSLTANDDCTETTRCMAGV